MGREQEVAREFVEEIGDFQQAEEQESGEMSVMR